MTRQRYFRYVKHILVYLQLIVAYEFRIADIVVRDIWVSSWMSASFLEMCLPAIKWNWKSWNSLIRTGASAVVHFWGSLDDLLQHFDWKYLLAICVPFLIFFKKLFWLENIPPLECIASYAFEFWYTHVDNKPSKIVLCMKIERF